MNTALGRKPASHALSAPAPAIIVLGVDGAGKTTAASALTRSLRAQGLPARKLANPAGRRFLSRLEMRLDIHLPQTTRDRVESAIRILNTGLNLARRALLPGPCILDRHLYCQLALRQARSLPAGRWLPLLASRTTRSALVVLLDVDAATAYRRVCQRGQDHEPFEHLRLLRQAYLRLAQEHGWPIIDAAASPEEVADRLRALLDSRLGP